MEHELADRKIVIHFGWTLSSGLDSMSIGVTLFSIVRLPKVCPSFDFHIDYSNPKTGRNFKDSISKLLVE